MRVVVCPSNCGGFSPLVFPTGIVSMGVLFGWGFCRQIDSAVYFLCDSKTDLSLEVNARWNGECRYYQPTDVDWFDTSLSGCSCCNSILIMTVDKCCQDIIIFLIIVIAIICLFKLQSK